MQTYHLTRLASIQNFNTIKRSLTRTTGPVLRKLIQSESTQTTNYLRSNYGFRYASTASSSSNDEQNSQENEQKKKNITNLMYLAGALTGLGAIYSIFQSRKSSNEKKQAASEYDEKLSASKKTLIEKVSDLQDRKLLAEEESPEEVDKKDLTPNIPNFAQYLIIGGGATAMSAFKSIRAHDATAKVLVISSEKYYPYMRPPLSKDIWYTDDDNVINNHSFKQWNGKEKSLYFFDEEFYTDVKTLNDQENGGVGVVRGRKVVNLDLKNSVAKLDNGWEISFEKCLIATGGQPKSLKVFQTASNRLKTKLTLYRGIDDFFALKKVIDSGADVTIVGGGFLGSELACALAHRAKENSKNGKPGGKVTQLMPETGNISKVLPEYLSKWATERVREEGAEVLTNVELIGTSIQEGKVNLSYIDPQKPRKTSYLTSDHIVIAVGIEPNTDLAQSAGLEVDSDQGGFLVNAELQARHNVWVAGDAASFYDIKLGRRRVEHYDHAVVSGKLAGENMTGAHKPYWHQSMFWSDLGPKVGFEAIGLTDSQLQTVAVYAKGKPDDEEQKDDSEGNREQKDVAPIATASELKHKLPETKSDTTNQQKDDYSKGVVFYLKENKVVGIVLWNIFNRIPIARKIIKDQQEITNFQELAKLFNIHQD
ncbi:hypothetical protein I4U23_017762 [Adineta vaga]|nr:hypothetical protein I4U23_017762 [Adineta vaga]